MLMQNALALGGERVGPAGTWVTRPFSACRMQIKPLIIGGEKGSYLVFVMLHNDSIFKAISLLLAPLLTGQLGYRSGGKSETDLCK